VFVVAKHPHQKAISVGHAMRKLLHLVFALWKTGRHFNPDHYPWRAPAHGEARDEPPAQDQAAGHTPDTEPARPVVTHRLPRPSTMRLAGLISRCTTPI
jgi:hypothetical protein